MGVRICHLKLGLRHSCFLNKSSWMGSCKVFQYSFDKASEILVLPDQCSKCPPLCARPKSDLKTGLVHFLCMALTRPPKFWSGRARAPKCSSLCDCLESDLQRGLVYFLSMGLTGPQKSWPGQTRALKCPPLCVSPKSDLDKALVHFLSIVLTGPQKGLRGAGQASQRSQLGQGRPAPARPPSPASQARAGPPGGPL